MLENNHSFINLVGNQIPAQTKNNHHPFSQLKH